MPLADSGRGDALLELLTNEDDYGWAGWLKQGGTFTPEAWGFGSQHLAPSAPGAEHSGHGYILFSQGGLVISDLASPNLPALAYDWSALERMPPNDTVSRVEFYLRAAE